MASQDVLKQLKVKTGVVKRLVKEHQYYVNEEKKQGEKIEKMRQDAGADEYVLKKAVEVHQESKSMISDAGRRLAAACEDLKRLGVENSLTGGTEFAEAAAQLEAADQVLAAL